MKNNKFKTIIMKLVNDRVLLAYLFLVIMFVIGEIIVPGFINFSHIMTVLQAAFFLGLIALGQTIVLISGKEGLDLSVGATFIVGVLLGAAINNGKDINLPLTIAVVLIAGFLLGLVNGFGVSFLGIAPLVMTMAWGIVIEGALLFINRGAYNPGKASPFLETLGNGSLVIDLYNWNIKIPWVVIIWVIIIIITQIIMKRTTVGYILYGVGSNSRVAGLLGIRTKIVRMSAYGFSGMLSALSGLLLLGYVGSPNFNLGARYVLPSVLAVVIGGVSFGGGYGSYIGVVAGSIFLTTLSSVLVTLGFSEGGRQLITGTVLLLLLLTYIRRRK
jgi:ribose transport system permease protein